VIRVRKLPSRHREHKFSGDRRSARSGSSLAAGDPDFQGIDVVQHVTWGGMDPASLAFESPGERDPRYAGAIPAYYRYIDHTLGQIRELAPEQATRLVVSDHGAGPLRLEHAFHLQLDVLLGMIGLQAP
jgi:hypothetical protein